MEGKNVAGRGGAVGEGAESSPSGGPVKSRLLERLRRWVEQESPSGDEARLTRLAEEIATALEGVGGVVERIPAPGRGVHLRCMIDGEDPGLAPLVILGHFDTVHPVGMLERLPFEVVGDRVTGPGIYDMKAGIAVLVEALEELRESGARPRRTLLILLTCDEEVGSPTSRGLIEETAEGTFATLVLEPPIRGGGAKTARKGVGGYTLRVEGRAAHAGLEPERGVSAIDELVRQLARIGELAAPELGTTINVGVISGGSAINVVAASASAEIDLRFSTGAEGERVDRAIRGLEPFDPRAVISIEGGINRPPLERTPAVAALYDRARTIAEELGHDLPEGSSGGGSDGCFTAAIGVPTLDGLGVDGDGAHTAEEYIRLSDLMPRVALVRRLLGM